MLETAEKLNETTKVLNDYIQYLLNQRAQLEVALIQERSKTSGDNAKREGLSSDPSGE